MHSCFACWRECSGKKPLGAENNFTYKWLSVVRYLRVCPYPVSAHVNGQNLLWINTRATRHFLNKTVVVLLLTLSSRGCIHISYTNATLAFFSISTRVCSSRVAFFWGRGWLIVLRFNYNRFSPALSQLLVAVFEVVVYQSSFLL